MMFPLIFFTFAIIASGIFVNKLLLFTLTPMLLTGIRMFSAGSILFVYNLKELKTVFTSFKKNFLIILATTLFITFLPSILKAYALKNLQVSHAALLGSIDPFITALYAYIIWKEKLNLTKIFGILLGLFATIILPNLGKLNFQLCTSTSTLLPQLAAITSCMINRLGWILAQIMLKQERFKISQLNSLTMLISGILALIICPFIEPISSIHISSYGPFIFLLLFTIFVGNILGYNVYGYTIKKYDITLISLAGCSVPLLVSIYNWIFIGQKISSIILFSITLLFISMLIFHFDKKISSWIQKNLFFWKQN